MNFNQNKNNIIFMGASYIGGKIFDLSDRDLEYREMSEKVVRLSFDLLHKEIKNSEGSSVEIGFLPLHSQHRKYCSLPNFQMPTASRAFNIERERGERATFILNNYDEFIYQKTVKFMQDGDIVITFFQNQNETLLKAFTEWKSNFIKYQEVAEKVKGLKEKKEETKDPEIKGLIDKSIKDLERGTYMPSFGSLIREISEKSYSFGNGFTSFFRTFKPVTYLKDVGIMVLRVCKNKYTYKPTVEDIFYWIDVLEESGKLLPDRIERQEKILADKKSSQMERDFAEIKKKAFTAMLNVEDLFKQLSEEEQERMDSLLFSFSSKDMFKTRCVFAILEFIFPLTKFKFKVRGLEPDMKRSYSLEELYTIDYEPLTSVPELEVVASSVIDSGFKPFVAPNPYTTAAMLASGLLEKSHVEEISEIERENIELEDLGKGDAGVLRFSMMKTENKVTSVSSLPTGERVCYEETKRSFVPVCSVFCPDRLELDVFNVQQN